MYVRQLIISSYAWVINFIKHHPVYVLYIFHISSSAINQPLNVRLSCVDVRKIKLSFCK